MKIENLPFLVFLKIGPSFFGCAQKCREISKNALSQHVAFACSRCLAGHKVGKEVTERHVGLTKKCWKKREMRGDEGKMLENCGKKGGKKKKERGKREKRRKIGEKREKGENWRRKVERREQERREGWEAQRAEGLLHDVTNVVGILPAMSRPPLHEKRPCSNRLGKKDKKLREKSQKCTFEQSAHWFVALGSAISGNQAQGNDLGQTALVQEWPNNCEKPTENATKLTAHSSRHCPKSSKIPQKHVKNDKFMIKISKNTTKTRQKRQFDVQN